MNIEHIVQLEEAMDRLEHTRSCITICLANSKPCQCGLEDIKIALDKYGNSQWKEQHEYDNIIRK